MGYINGQIGDRSGLLFTRSVVRKGNFVLLEPDGLVKQQVPGYEKCDVTIMASPTMGASFVDYLITVGIDGKNMMGIGGEGLEVFLYVIEGQITVWNMDEKAILTNQGYFFSPSGKAVFLKNESEKVAKVYLYKRKYHCLTGYHAHTITSNEQNIEWNFYEGMEHCFIKSLLPAQEDFGFDMNMHILRFGPGASHGYIETHIQEHGIYVLSGKGMYRVDDEWIAIQKGDYLFLDAYCPQACYAVGDREDFIYIYSKDCNRDVIL